MKRLLLKFFGVKRGAVADLNQEAINAAGEYMKKKGLVHLPLIEQQQAVNYLSHGFYMGYRKAEEAFGVTE